MTKTMSFECSVQFIFLPFLLHVTVSKHILKQNDIK